MKMKIAPTFPMKPRNPEVIEPPMEIGPMSFPVITPPSTFCPMLRLVPTTAYAKRTATSVPEIDQSTPTKATRVIAEFKPMRRNDSVPVVKFFYA